jgi:hypothetical protein
MRARSARVTDSTGEEDGGRAETGIGGSASFSSKLGSTRALASPRRRAA